MYIIYLCDDNEGPEHMSWRGHSYQYIGSKGPETASPSECCWHVPQTFLCPW